MKLTINKRTLATVLSTLFAATDAVVESDNINGVHTVYAGQHFADTTCTFPTWCSGNDWGDNGQPSWHVKVTFSESAVSYSGGSCFADTLQYYDWNKVRDPLIIIFTRSMRCDIRAPIRYHGLTHYQMYHFFNAARYTLVMGKSSMRILS